MKPSALTETERQERQHARISPSRLKQIVGCLGSLAKLEKHPHLDIDQTNEYTLSGNKTGAILEEALNHLYDARGKEISKTIPPIVFQDCEDDRKERILAAVDYISEFRKDVEEIYNDPDWIFFQQEIKVDCWDLIDGEKVSGSPDLAFAWRSGDQIHVAILDLKDGRGEVKASTPQLVAYAAGVCKRLVESKLALWSSFHQIHLGIIQPRIENYDHRIVTFEELKKEIKHLKEQSILALELCKEPEEKIDAYLNPDRDYCFFCKVKSVCPAIQKPAIEFFTPIVEEVEPKPTVQSLLQDMDDEKKKRLLVNFKLLEELKKTVQAEFLSRVKAGEKIPGMKVVNTKAPSRVWAESLSVDARRELLRKEGANPTELVDLSPAQVEKQLGKKKFEALNLVAYKSYGYAVVGVEDKRKEVDLVNVEIEFEVVEEE